MKPLQNRANHCTTRARVRQGVESHRRTG
jgi:hypothetical protein